MNWYKYALEWNYEPFLRDYDLMQEREDYARQRPQKELEKEHEWRTKNDRYIIRLLQLFHNGLRVPQITQELQEEGYEVNNVQVAKALISANLISPEELENYFE